MWVLRKLLFAVVMALLAWLGVACVLYFMTVLVAWLGISHTALVIASVFGVLCFLL